MQEKVLISSSNNKFSFKIKICILLTIIFLGYCLTLFFIFKSDAESERNYSCLRYEELKEDDDPYYRLNDYYDDCHKDIFTLVFFDEATHRYEMLYAAAGVYAISIVIVFLLGSNVVVTNKKITHKRIFGKINDLPIDSVSSISKFSLIKTLFISTSSGNIRAFFIDNCDDIYSYLNELISNRTTNKDSSIKEERNIEVKSQNTIEELKQYKELLDMGAITEEEYNKKKKELLNL